MHQRLRPCKIYFCIATILINLLNIFTLTPTTYANGCKDVEFIFARGSGESLNDKSYREWEREIIAQLVNSTLTYEFYELGSSNKTPYQYPATAVSGGFWDYVNLVSAYFSAGEAFEFGASVSQGINELKYHISQVSAACPRTKFVLGGYSQGAMVMTKTLPDLNPERIIFVTNFGDPKLYLPEGNNMSGILPKVPDACRGEKLSDYRTYVPDCHAYEGVLGSQRPYRKEVYIGKVGTWCNNSDIMCSSGMNINDHSQYISEHLYADAARKIYQKLTNAFPSKFPEQKSIKLHDVAFVLDATGSMFDLMKLYRPELKNLAKQVFENGGRAAIYGYRDSRDERSSWQICDFECTETEFFNRLGYYIASGGGDAKESLLSALHYTMKELDWQWGATKSIVVLTDDGYKEPDFEGVTLAQVIRESLVIDPVNIYVIGPESIKDDYIDLTTQSGGAFFGLLRLDESTEAENLAKIQASTSQILNRPVAKLQNTAYQGVVGNEFTFDASESYGFHGDALQYEWDLDGDGIFEVKTNSSYVQKIFNSTFDNFIQVRVSDGISSSTMSAKVVVAAQTTFELPVEVTRLGCELNDTSAKVTFTTTGDYVLASLDDTILGFVKTEQGQGEFMIGELTQDATITLTPYSATKRRGISASTNIEIDKPAPSIPNEETPTPPITGEITPANPVSSQPPSIPSTSPKPQPDVPYAPDTGAYDRKLLPVAMGT